MGDGTSAGIFADIFAALAKNIDKVAPEVRVDRLQLAKRFYKLQERLDFNDDDMDEDDALLALDLAKACPHCGRPVTESSARYHKKGEC